MICHSGMWKNHPQVSLRGYKAPKALLIIVFVLHASSSTIIQELIGHCKSNPSFAIAYFYFDFRDRGKQSYEHLLRSLVTQFSAQCPSTPEALERLYSSNQDGRWQPAANALVTTLGNIIGSFQQTYIVVDALDECTDREGLLGLIEEIVNWKINSLHILVTSRKEREINECLKDLISNQMGIQCSLVAADIRIHVHEKLHKDPQLKKWPDEVLAEMETELTERADGM
jgi:hypothetical protein